MYFVRQALEGIDVKSLISNVGVGSGSAGGGGGGAAAAGDAPAAEEGMAAILDAVLCCRYLYVVAVMMKTQCAKFEFRYEISPIPLSSQNFSFAEFD